MQTKVTRELFLNSLEAMTAGLAKKETVEQSSCFCFLDGFIYTTNEEVACRFPSPLPKDFTGAVPAEKLLSGLRKLPDDELDVSIAEAHLIFRGKGKRRELAVRLESEITLPIESIEKPKGWQPLHKDFAEAVGVVQRSAGVDASEFALTCVNIHPEWVEAADGYQVCRWKLKTGIEQPTLVKKSALRSIVSLGMTEFSETQNWIHFRSPSKLVLSCRRYLEDYRSDTITGILAPKGESAQLPKGLVDATAIAEEFSKENIEDNNVLIELRPGWIRMTGRGISGWYRETKKVQYQGKKLAFLIDPGMLSEIVKRHNDVQLAEEKLKVDTGSYIYVACLVPPEAKQEKEEEEETERKGKGRRQEQEEDEE